MKKQNDSELFDDRGAADYLKTNPRTLRDWRRKFGLPHIRISSHSLRYRKSDLVAWLTKRSVGGAR